MALRKSILEVPITGGLEQKFAPQRLQNGKSAKAENLVMQKAGRLDKRLGVFPLSGADPFGSGYALNTGVALGAFNDGSGVDNLMIMGRGTLPNTSSTISSLQAYSDNLGGPVIRGPIPDVAITYDGTSSASNGTCFSPQIAAIGDYLVTVWIDPSTEFGSGAMATQPVGSVGALGWSVTSISTNQEVVGPSLVNPTTDPDVQFVRLAAVGNTFVICYSATSPNNSPATNGYIFCQTLPLATLVSGGKWSAVTNITTANAATVNPYVSSTNLYLAYQSGGAIGIAAAAFDMKAVIGDATSFVVAYETGTYNGGDPRSAYWSGTNIVVDRWAVGSPPTKTSTWTVAAAPSGVNVVCGFGVRAEAALGQVAVCWSQAVLNSPHVINAAIANYPAMSGGTSPAVIYTATDNWETCPYWIDVSKGSSSASPYLYMESHSPMGSCWNAAFTTTSAIGAAGTGAAATATMSGSVFSTYITSASSYNYTGNPYGNFSPNKTIAMGQGAVGGGSSIKSFAVGEVGINDVSASSGLFLVGTSQPHGLATGNNVYIQGVTGTPNANGGWTVTVVDSTDFTLNSSSYAGSYTGGGIFYRSDGLGSLTTSGAPLGSAFFQSSASPHPFTLADVGKTLTITSSANTANLGSFTIQAFNSSTGVQIANPAAVTDASGSMSWKISGGTGFTATPTMTSSGGIFNSGFQAEPSAAAVAMFSVASVAVTSGGAKYSVAPTVVFDRGGAPTTYARLTATLGAGGTIQSINVVNGGAGYTSTPDVTIVDISGLGSGATATAVMKYGSTGGVITSVNLTSGGSGYLNAQVYVSGGAAAIATVTAGAVSSVAVTANGQYYQAPPNVTLVSPYNLVGLSQTQQNRVILPYMGGGGGTTLSSLQFPENNARIIQNQFGLIAGTVGLSPYASGGTNVGTNGDALITPGVTLASSGLEANGIIYYLGWIPSLTQGGFVILACDRACNIASTISGNGFPMRTVGSLQTRTALADPGWGFQPAPGINFPSTGYVHQSPASPNAWSGGSGWFASGDSYNTSYVAYVSSSQGERLAPAYGAIQTLPRSGYPTATWGNTTAIGGALPSLYDGQNVFEQGFLYAPESVIVQPINPAGMNLGTPLSGAGGSLTWSLPTDSYSWIFTWEHFDAQGNFHISPRSAQVTVSGQNLLDALGNGTLGPLTSGYQTLPIMTEAAPWVGGMQFTIPTLGVTNRLWPQTNVSTAYGRDLRQHSTAPSAPVILGAYRTIVRGLVYYRIGDRFFNGDDIGDSGFTLAPPVANTYESNFTPGTIDHTSYVGTVVLGDGLADNILNGVQAASPFPELYGDGTDGIPGELDNYCPPATTVMASDTERLYVARDNVVMWTKSRAAGQGPGYNEVNNSISVGDDDPIIGMAVMDDKVVVLKASGNWYLSGQGSADDGTGGTFVANYIPTDLGCISGVSVLSTPEGVYYQSAGGLRLVDRSLTVRYIGGPVEDEINNYPFITGCALYPQKSRMIVLANTSNFAAIGSQLNGECVIRDYVLDAWTTTKVINGTTQTGFISAAIAYGKGTGGAFFTVTPSPKMHLLGADGVVWREHDPIDSAAYYDNNTYIVSTWVTAPIVAPSDGTTSLQSRFRLYDCNAIIVPASPFGMNISVAIDYGNAGNTRNWVWNNGTTTGSIAPGGVLPTPLVQLRTYDGRLGESFQLTFQDVYDSNTFNGQGAQFLGLTVTIGTPDGPYKLPGSSTQ